MENPVYTFDYFSVRETEAFRFYQVPQVFFEDERFTHPKECKFSAEAKLLYAVLLNRVSLSKLNNWIDKEGRVYIVCTNKEVQKLMACADQKATKILKELEVIGLIQRKKTMKADMIYVMNFATLPPLDKNPEPDFSDEPPTHFNEPTDPENTVENSSSNTNCTVENFSSKNNFDENKVFHSDFPHDDGLSTKSRKSRLRNRENHDHENVKITTTKSPKSRYSNTDLSNTNSSNPNLINPSDFSDKQQIKIDRLMDVIKAQIDYDILLHDNPRDENRLNEIVSIILSVLISQEEFLVVGGVKTLKTLVHQNFLKLRHEHIEYVFECLKNTTTEIRNIKAYLTTALYNAPSTIDHYYTQRVRHDMGTGGFKSHTEQEEKRG